MQQKKSFETYRVVDENTILSIWEKLPFEVKRVYVMQGMKKKEIKALYSHEYDYFMNKPDVYRNEDAESFADMYKRAEDFLQDIKYLKFSRIPVGCCDKTCESIKLALTLSKSDT